MTIKQLIILLSISFFMIAFSLQKASGQPTSAVECKQLEEKVSGKTQKYSINAYVEALVSFDSIDCGVEFRKDLCAMDMASFDVSAVVYDFNTGEELLMQETFFIINPPPEITNKKIISFKTEAAAKQFATEHGGKAVNFDKLVY